VARHTTCNTVANCAAISAWPAAVGSVKDGRAYLTCQRVAEAGLGEEARVHVAESPG
jgi:hypothetical protein